MDMSLLVYPVTILGVSGLILLAGSLFPSLRKFDSCAIPFEELQKRYTKWEVLFGFIYLLFILTCGTAVWFVIRFLAGLRYTNLKGIWVLVPGPWIWAMVTIPAALAFGGFVAQGIARLLLKERMREYICYESKKFGLDASRLFLPLAMFLLAVFAGMTLLFMDYHVRIDASGITINRLWSFRNEMYTFSDVTEVKTWRRQFRHQSEARMRLEFSNFTNWESRWSPRELNDKEVCEIAEYVSSRADLHIEACP
jgi:hypothetical protein